MYVATTRCISCVRRSVINATPILDMKQLRKETKYSHAHTHIWHTTKGGIYSQVHTGIDCYCHWSPSRNRPRQVDLWLTPIYFTSGDAKHAHWTLRYHCLCCVKRLSSNHIRWLVPYNHTYMYNSNTLSKFKNWSNINIGRRTNRSIPRTRWKSLMQNATIQLFFLSVSVSPTFQHFFIA